MDKPEISSRFDVDDIRKVRKYKEIPINKKETINYQTRKEVRKTPLPGFSAYGIVLREKVLFQRKNDGNDAERDCCNQIMEKRIMEGKQGIEQERYPFLSSTLEI